MRTEFAMIEQENTKFFAQVEQVDAELTRMGEMVGDRENCYHTATMQA